MATTSSCFNSASIGAIAPNLRTTNGNPVRISFIPYGNRRIGDDDPEAPDYQIIDARAYHSAELPAHDRPVVFLEDVMGRHFVLADGSEFLPDNEVDVDIDQSLADLGTVLGKQTENGYVAVGIHPVILTPK